MEQLQEVRVGERPRASDMEALRERVEALTDAHLRAQPPKPEVTYIDLYELTSDPEFDDDAREYKATAKPVGPKYVAVDADGHWVADGWNDGTGTKPRARRLDDQPTSVLWFLTAPRDEQQEAACLPAYQTGDRVLVTTWGLDLVVVEVTMCGEEPTGTPTPTGTGTPTPTGTGTPTPTPTPTGTPTPTSECVNVADLPVLERDLDETDYAVIVDADGCWWKKAWYDCDASPTPTPTPEPV